MVIVRHRYRHRWPLTSCFPVSKKRPGPPASFIHQAFKSRWTWVRGQVCCQYHLFYSKRLAHSLGKSYSYLTVAWCVRLWNAQTSYWQFERQRFAISTTTLIPLHLQSVDGKKTLLALHIEEWQVSHLRGIGDWKLWSWLGLKICSALVSFGKQSMLQHFLDSIHTALLRFGVLSTWMAKQKAIPPHGTEVEWCAEAVQILQPRFVSFIGHCLFAAHQSRGWICCEGDCVQNPGVCGWIVCNLQICGAVLLPWFAVMPSLCARRNCETRFSKAFYWRGLLHTADHRPGKWSNISRNCLPWDFESCCDLLSFVPPATRLGEAGREGTLSWIAGIWLDQEQWSP